MVALGEVGLLQFKDLNTDKSAFQRTYANQVGAASCGARVAACMVILAPEGRLRRVAAGRRRVKPSPAGSPCVCAFGFSTYNWPRRCLPRPCNPWLPAGEALR